jgi:hypothetical protein
MNTKNAAPIAATIKPPTRNIPSAPKIVPAFSADTLSPWYSRLE